MKRYAQLTVRGTRVLVATSGDDTDQHILAVIGGDLLLAPADGGYQESHESERGRQAILHQNGGGMPDGLSRGSILAIKKAAGQGLRKARGRVRQRRRA